MESWWGTELLCLFCCILFCCLCLKWYVVLLQRFKSDLPHHSRPYDCSVCKLLIYCRSGYPVSKPKQTSLFHLFLVWWETRNYNIVVVLRSASFTFQLLTILFARNSILPMGQIVKLGDLNSSNEWWKPQHSYCFSNQEVISNRTIVTNKRDWCFDIFSFFFIDLLTEVSSRICVHYRYHSPTPTHRNLKSLL